MAHSGEVWVLNKIAELAKRCGVSPAVADISLSLQFPDNYSYHYSIMGVSGVAHTPQEEAAIEKMWSLLGLDGSGCGKAADLREVEERVDRALSLAPRARSR